MLYAYRPSANFQNYAPGWNLGGSDFEWSDMWIVITISSSIIFRDWLWYEKLSIAYNRDCEENEMRTPFGLCSMMRKLLTG